jgi:hypothetical protein
MISLLAAALLSTNVLTDCALPTNATPAELVASCRTMIPADARLEGRIVLRTRRGIVQAEHRYELTRTAGRTTLAVDGKSVPPPESASEPLFGTDVTWSDLTLDYLWWDDFSFDGEREGETVHGQRCSVLVLRRGPRAVRVWIDRKTGAMMQAEEVSDGRPVRRLWGTRIKKFNDRWVPSQLECETLGSGRRTKITVEKMEI